jgi:hypothetical protein
MTNQTDLQLFEATTIFDTLEMAQEEQQTQELVRQPQAGAVQKTLVMRTAENAMCATVAISPVLLLALGVYILNPFQ